VGRARGLCRDRFRLTWPLLACRRSRCGRSYKRSPWPDRAGGCRAAGRRSTTVANGRSDAQAALRSRRTSGGRGWSRPGCCGCRQGTGDGLDHGCRRRRSCRRAASGARPPGGPGLHAWSGGTFRPLRRAWRRWGNLCPRVAPAPALA